MSQNVTTGEGNAKSTIALSFEVLFLLLIALAALIGNLLVITVIYKSRRVQWLTNLFVAHLAGSNLLVPLLSAPVYIDWSIEGSWMIGPAMCKFVHFSHYVNSGVSIFMLACMALDRYYVIVHPLSLHMGRSQTFQLITFAWTFAVFASTPTLYFYDTTMTSDAVLCDFVQGSSSWKGYITAFTILIFVMPLGITGVLYGIVVKTIIERNSTETYSVSTFLQVPSCNQKILGKVPKTKQKVVKMLIIQTIFFLVCWTPFYIRQFVESWLKLRSHELLVVTYWLAFSNSACSPILYTVTNSNFRRGCKHLCSVHVSRPYTLSHVINRKHQVDVLGGEISRNESPSKIPEYDYFYTQKSVSEGSRKKDNITKLFTVSTQDQREAWSSEVESKAVGSTR